jgi:hypothetical protein
MYPQSSERWLGLLETFVTTRPHNPPDNNIRGNLQVFVSLLTKFSEKNSTYSLRQVYLLNKVFRGLCGLPIEVDRFPKR